MNFNNMEKLKWCIKRTEENYREVNEWANKTFGRNYFDDMDYLVIQKNGKDCCICFAHTISADFHEITLDEFRLLTDPEKYQSYSIKKTDIDYNLRFVKGKSASYKQEIEYQFPVVSCCVFNELQRMWKEKEDRQKEDDNVIKTEHGFKTKDGEPLPERNYIFTVSCGQELDNNLNPKNFIHQLKHELKQIKKGMKQIQKTIDKFEGRQF